jgi:hypothetical protein
MDPKAFDCLARALERFQGRILHHPLQTLKQTGKEGEGAEAAAWVSRLFRLERQGQAEEGSGSGRG